MRALPAQRLPYGELCSASSGQPHGKPQKPPVVPLQLFPRWKKRGLKCTGCSAALRGQAAGWENQGLPARVGSSQEGRIWAVLSPGRAGGSGRWGGRCWEQCWWCWRSLAGSRRPSTVKPVKLDSYGGASLIGALSSSNLQIHAICTFRHNLFETGRRTEPLERGTHRHRHA